MAGKTATKTASKNTDKKTKAAEEEIEDEDLDDADLEEDEDEESEDDDKTEGKKEPKPENNQEGYYMRKAKKLEKELAESKAAQAKSDKELQAERKKLESRAEVEKYDDVLEKLEAAGLPPKMRKLIDLSWDDERIDEAIEQMQELVEEAAEKSSNKSKVASKNRRRQDVDDDDDDDTDDDEEEEAPRKQQRRTRQAGEDRPERRSGRKLRDLSSITDPAKRIEEAAKDI